MSPKRKPTIHRKRPEFHLKVAGGPKINYDPKSIPSIDRALTEFDQLSEAQRIKWIKEHPDLAHIFRRPGKR